MARINYNYLQRVQGELSSISKADEADLCYVAAYAYMLLLTNVYHSSQGKEDQTSFCLILSASMNARGCMLTAKNLLFVLG